MALTPRLDTRQSQALVMTLQLQQAIKLLQLTNLEITAYVDDQLERNPLLELAEGGEADAGGSPAEGAEADAGGATRGSGLRPRRGL